MTVRVMDEPQRREEERKGITTRLVSAGVPGGAQFALNVFVFFLSLWFNSLGAEPGVSW